MRRITADEAWALREAAAAGPWEVGCFGQLLAEGFTLLSVDEEDGFPRIRSKVDGDLIAAAPDLAFTVEALEAEVEELRATLAAERGDPSGALPGWRWNGRVWVATDTYADAVPCGPGHWSWRFGLRFGYSPTARDAMRAADAAREAK